MATEVSISLSQLQDLVNDVQQSQHQRTIRLAEGVVAVVKPERKPAKRSSGPQLSVQRLSSLSIEDVYGAVPTPLHLQGRDIDEMIREAKDDRLDSFLRS